MSIALEIGNTDIAELLRNAGGREDLKEVTFSGALTNWLQGVGNFENIVEFFRILTTIICEVRLTRKDDVMKCYIVRQILPY